jgi:hypothetical protein
MYVLTNCLYLFPSKILKGKKEAHHLQRMLSEMTGSSADGYKLLLLKCQSLNDSQLLVRKKRVRNEQETSKKRALTFSGNRIGNSHQASTTDLDYVRPHHISMQYLLCIRETIDPHRLSSVVPPKGLAQPARSKTVREGLYFR